MIFYRRSRNSGVTLVEVLIATAAAALIGTILILILVQNNNIFVQQTLTVNEKINLSDTSTNLEHELKNASGILTTAAVSGVTYSSNESTIIISLPSIDTNGNNISNALDTLIYSKDLTNPKLLKKITSASSLSTRKSANFLVINNLSSISINYLDLSGSPVQPDKAARVRFSITTTSPIFNGQSKDIIGEVRLRNH